MKVVFSRKGFDSKNGGVASPILPDGRLCSLPIPDGASEIEYRGISFGDLNLGDIVEDLTRRKVRGNHLAHLDPDLSAAAFPRKKGWRGNIGPGGRPRAHLENNGLAAGDMFLFFGWFRQTEWHNGKLRFVRGAPDMHVLFGWLQVGAITQAADFSAKDKKWAQYHPHFHPERRDWASIHIGVDFLNLPALNGKVPGYGIFPKYRDELRLTAPESTRGIWRLPSWFYPGKRKALSCHADAKRWRRAKDWVDLASAPIGQEFVLDCDQYPESAAWINALFG